MLQKNFALVLVDQMIHIVVSALLEHGKKDFVNAYEAFLRGKYSIVVDMKGFLLKERFKNNFKNSFRQFPQGKALAIYVSFHTGMPHALALQVSENQFRLIDSNMEILKFDNEDELINVLSDYRTNFFGQTDDPRTLAAVAVCAP